MSETCRALHKRKSNVPQQATDSSRMNENEHCVVHGRISDSFLLSESQTSPTKRYHTSPGVQSNHSIGIVLISYSYGIPVRIAALRQLMFCRMKWGFVVVVVVVVVAPTTGNLLAASFSSSPHSAIVATSLWSSFSMSSSSSKLGADAKMTACAAPATTTTTTSTKTVYLIRHAESEENRRLASLSTVARSLMRFTWPAASDVTASMEFIQDLPNQIDSDVSEFGRQQIAHMASVLLDQSSSEQPDQTQQQQQSPFSFLATRNIQLVAHSPLIRARETCFGMLGLSDPTKKNDNDDATTADATSNKNDNNNGDHPVPVVELDLLREKTPAEWIPGNAGGLAQRIADLETWVSQRPESVLVLVGHSQFFKSMLQLNYKFGNCDVMRVQFQTTTAAAATSATSEQASAESADLGMESTTAPTTKPPSSTSPWSDVIPVHLCRLPRPSSLPTPSSSSPLTEEKSNQETKDVEE